MNRIGKVFATVLFVLPGIIVVVLWFILYFGVNLNRKKFLNFIQNFNMMTQIPIWRLKNRKDLLLGASYFFTNSLFGALPLLSWCAACDFEILWQILLKV